MQATYQSTPRPPFFVSGLTSFHRGASRKHTIARQEAPSTINSTSLLKTRSIVTTRRTPIPKATVKPRSAPRTPIQKGPRVIQTATPPTGAKTLAPPSPLLTKRPAPTPSLVVVYSPDTKSAGQLITPPPSPTETTRAPRPHLRKLQLPELVRSRNKTRVIVSPKLKTLQLPVLLQCGGSITKGKMSSSVVIANASLDYEVEFKGRMYQSTTNSTVVQPTINSYSAEPNTQCSAAVENTFSSPSSIASPALYNDGLSDSAVTVVDDINERTKVVGDMVAQHVMEFAEVVTAVEVVKLSRDAEVASIVQDLCLLNSTIPVTAKAPSVLTSELEFRDCKANNLRPSLSADNTLEQVGEQTRASVRDILNAGVVTSGRRGIVQTKVRGIQERIAALSARMESPAFTHTSTMSTGGARVLNLWRPEEDGTREPSTSPQIRTELRGLRAKKVVSIYSHVIAETKAFGGSKPGIPNEEDEDIRSKGLLAEGILAMYGEKRDEAGKV